MFRLIGSLPRVGPVIRSSLAAAGIIQVSEKKCRPRADNLWRFVRNGQRRRAPVYERLLDLARSDADGVHVGSTVDLPARRRIVGPRDWWGLDPRSNRPARPCCGADYIGIGPVFLRRRRNSPSAGLILSARRRQNHTPVYAIGGIHLDNIDVLSPPRSPRGCL